MSAAERLLFLPAQEFQTHAVHLEVGKNVPVVGVKAVFAEVAGVHEFLCSFLRFAFTLGRFFLAPLETAAVLASPEPPEEPAAECQSY